MTKYLRVKDWDKYQHYKDRNPPWIKLETDTFINYDFARLHDASKLLAICIWTLASRYKDPKLGLVPNDFQYIKRQCNLGDLVKPEHLKELINQGYIIDASNMLADCKQSAIPETETYSKETEAETKIDLLSENQFETFWTLYGRIGTKQKALNSWKKLKGTTYEEIINGHARYAEYCSSNGDWYRKQHAATWLNGRGWDSEWAVQITESAQDRRSRESREAAVRGMLRAENPDF